MKKLNDKNSELVEKIINVIYLEKGLSKNTKSAYKSDILLIFNWFNDKKVNQAITVKIISTDNKGLIVRPEGCDMDFNIKKSQIAINAADARPSRFTGGERIDCAIAELSLEKRKVSLSIKLLEELERQTALEKYGAEEGSGKQLPFSTLSEDLKKKDKNKN